MTAEASNAPVPSSAEVAAAISKFDAGDPPHSVGSLQLYLGRESSKFAYRGVRKVSTSGGWRARFGDGGSTQIGIFSTAVEAAIAFARHPEVVTRLKDRHHQKNWSRPQKPAGCTKDDRCVRGLNHAGKGGHCSYGNKYEKVLDKITGKEFLLECAEKTRSGYSGVYECSNKPQVPHAHRAYVIGVYECMARRDQTTPECTSAATSLRCPMHSGVYVIGVYECTTRRDQATPECTSAVYLLLTTYYSLLTNWCAMMHASASPPQGKNYHAKSIRTMPDGVEAVPFQKYWCVHRVYASLTPSPPIDLNIMIRVPSYPLPPLANLTQPHPTPTQPHFNPTPT